jgi:gluconate 2-dehydrogenase gamma chain
MLAAPSKEHAPMADKFSRRIFLKVSGAAAVTPAATHAVAQGTHAQHTTPTAPATGNAPQGYLFFTANEAAFIEPAVDRLIPPDANGPGAREAAVPRYIDLQLAGAWGAGERLYRSGPWQPGTPQQGYQLPYTPAELFRNALRGVALDLQKQNQAFAQMDGAAQDAYLTRLQNGTFDLEGVPAHVFFESLLAMTIEGYFSDPVYGGNAGMGAWAMIGFPGAYGNYYELVERHGIAFNVPPRSLGEDGEGRVHTIAMGSK